MKKWKSFSDWRLRTKLFFILALCLVVSMLLSVYNMFHISRAYDRELYGALSNFLSLSVTEIGYKLDNVQQMTTDLGQDSQIQTYLSHNKDASRAFSSEYNALYYLVQDYYKKNRVNCVSNITLYTGNFTLRSNTSANVYVPDEVYKDLYEAALGANGATVCVTDYSRDYGLFFVKAIRRIENLVKVLADLQNSGRQIILVSSGAIGVGSGKLGLKERPQDTPTKQACASIGQCELMYVYDKLFSQYNHCVSQILLTRDIIENEKRTSNVINTMNRLISLNVIPIVNENDTVSTYEMQFGDNDTLSAIVASLIGADLLILLSDIDGLFTDDPHKNPGAKLIEVVEEMDASIYGMAKSSTGSDVGTGGMATKLTAAKIATLSGTDMIIANGRDVCILHHIFDDSFKGTIFQAKKKESFRIEDFILETIG